MCRSIRIGSLLLYIGVVWLIAAIPLLTMESFAESVSTLDKWQNYLHIFFHAITFAIIIGLLTLRRWSMFLAAFFIVAGGFWGISTRLYYEYFRVPPDLLSLSNFGNSPEIIHQVAAQLLGPVELVIFVLVVLALILLYPLAKINYLKVDQKFIYLTCCALLLIALLRVGAIYWRHDIADVYRHDRVQALKQFGWTSNILLQLKIASTEFPVPPFPGRICENDDLYEPIERLKPNILIVQVESLDQRLVDMVVGEVEITPYLNAFAAQSLYYPNTFAQHRGGASQDAELSMLYSIIPRNGSSGFNSMSGEGLISLVDLLGANGYYTAAFHSNTGSFFNRNACLRLAGFDVFKDIDGFAGRAAGWMARDLDFVEQTCDYLSEITEPWLAYLITIQSHGPFRNYGTLGLADDLLVDSDLERDYLNSFREVDRAIGVLSDRFRNSGSHGRDTIIVITSDHASGIQPVESYGLPKEAERIPLIIYDPRVESQKIDSLASHYDVAPTLAGMVGVSAPETWLGRNLLASDCDQVIINGSSPLIIQRNGDKFSIIRDSSKALDTISWSISHQQWSFRDNN